MYYTYVLESIKRPGTRYIGQTADHDGWIQPTVALSGTGAPSEEVESWLGLLTEAQKNPVHHSAAGSVLESLRARKLTGGQIELEWAPSCVAEDSDYEGCRSQKRSPRTRRRGWLAGSGTTEENSWIS